MNVFGVADGARRRGESWHSAAPGLTIPAPAFPSLDLQLPEL
jgi:hypothetical protein